MKTVVRLFAYGLLATFCLFSCKSSKIKSQKAEEMEQNKEKDDPQTPRDRDQSAGIEGQVFWVEGNQMPQLSENKKQEAAEQAGKPTKRTLRIHELTHINQANLGDYLFGDIETPLVKEVETNEEGYFKVELPPGRYSIFTVEEKGYFANVFDLDSYIHPVTIEKSGWNRIKILIDYQATY